MAEKPKSAADYLREAQQRASASQPPRAAASSEYKPVPFTKVDSNAPQSPLNWLMDILSRGVYAGTNPINSAAERAADINKTLKEGDTLGGVGKIVHAASPFTLAGDALTGFLSTDKKHQNLWSSTIENVTDKIGPMTDPSYEDRDDNVNPVLKGVAGFVGDVVLDPINLIPGAAFVKAGKGIKALAGATGSATKTAAGAIKDARSAGKKAVDESLTPDVTPQSATQAITDRIGAPSGRSAAETVRETPTGPLELERAIPGTPAHDSLLKTSARTVDTKLSSKKAKDLRAAIEGLGATATMKIKPKTETVEAVAKMVEETPTVVVPPVKTFKDWAAAADEQLLDVAPKDMPAVSVSGQKVPLNRALSLAMKGNAPASAGVRQFYEDVYAKAYRGASEEGMGVDALGRWQKLEASDITDAARSIEKGDELAEAVQHSRLLREDPDYARGILEDSLRNHPGTGDVPSLARLMDDADAEVRVLQAERAAADEGLTEVSASIRTAREDFLRLVDEDRKALEEVFGAKLVSNLLRNTTSEARFNEVVGELKSILDKTINLHSVRSVLPASVRMLSDLGIDFEALPKIAKQMQDVPNTSRVTVPVEELLAKLGDGPPDAELVLVVKKALGSSLKKDVFEPRNAQVYKFTSDGGVKVTTPADRYGEGVGNILNEFNQYKQVNLLEPIVKHYAGRIAEAYKIDKSIAGARRAHAMRRQVMPALRAVEEIYDRAGIPLVLMHGKGSQRIPLSYSQILDVLDDIDPKGMDAMMWNGSSAIAYTNLPDAAYLAITGASRADIERAVRNTTPVHSSGLPAHKQRSYENKITNPGKLGRVQLNGNELVKRMVDNLVAAAPRLQKAVDENAARMQKRSAEETAQLVDESLQNLETVFREGTIADLLKGIDTSLSRLGDVGREMGMTDLAKSTAAVATGEAIPHADRVLATTLTRAEKAMDEVARKLEGKIGTGKSQIPPVKAAEQMSRAAIPAAQRQFDEIAADTLKGSELDKTLDLGDRTLAELHGTWFRKQFIKVNRETQMKEIHEKVVGNENLWRDIVGRTADNLNKLSRQIGSRERFQQVFHAVQKGIPLTNPELAGYAAQVDDLVGQLFGRANSVSLMDNAFIRNGANLDHVNAAIARYVDNTGKIMFDADAAAAAAKANGTTLMQEAAQQWKTWEVRDPAAFLNGMYTALSKINVDQNIAQHWYSLAERHGAVSRTPKPGYARIVNDSGKSIFSKYLPEDVYFEENVLDMLHSADVLTQQSLGLATKHGEFGKFIAEVYKPVQDMWKTGMTVINPAHHVRNMVSDMSLIFLSEGWHTAGAYKKAMQVMATRQSYDNWDAIAALNGVGTKHRVGSTVANTKFGPITDDQLYAELANRGNLPTFRILEALEDEGDEISGTLGTWWKQQGHKRPLRAVGGITEARDHYVRIAHAIVALDKGDLQKKAKSMDELLDLVSHTVRKWHPDGSDLTSTEQAFKLIIPFYSWQRKSIPLIVESLLTKPQRVTVFPKATYNMAVAMGIDPDSLADPFPEDQMFPSYLTDQMHGPVFEVNNQYYGINPGFASSDVLSDFVGANPLRTIAGSVSPLIRAPWELLTGGQVGTGSRINDTSDFLDSQIPIVGPTSRVSGQSVTGSLYGLLSGQGLDPQYQIAKGNKDQATATTTALMNYLLGLGITPMSQPNQINYAEIEKRDRAAAGKE